MKAVVLLALVLFCGSAFCDGTDFVGVFLDTNGYRLNLCLTNGGSRLEGSFNEYGLIQADVYDNGATAIGSYYVTNYFSSPACAYGRFSWAINGDQITGTYACWDGLSGGDWNASRVFPQQTPSLSDCVILAEGGDLEGQWAQPPQLQNDWDICVHGDQFEASFVTDGGQPGYQWGDVFFNGRLLQGSYAIQLDEGGHRTKGGILLALYQDGSLFSFGWTDPVTDENVLAYQSPDSLAAAHRTLEFIQPTGQASNTDCARNKFLKTGDDADQFIGFDYNPLTVNAGEVLAVSILAILAAVALF